MYSGLSILETGVNLSNTQRAHGTKPSSLEQEDTVSFVFDARGLVLAQEILQEPGDGPKQAWSEVIFSHHILREKLLSS